MCVPACPRAVFTREGKYSSFGEKTLPKADAERARSATTFDPPSASANVAPEAPDRRASVVQTCAQQECRKPRVALKSFCVEHLAANAAAANASPASSPSSAAAAAAVSDEQRALSEAIASKSVDKVSAILKDLKSAELLLKPMGTKGSPVEQAFTGIANSRACGELMVDWLRKHVTELEKKQ
jgi:hypothetical protein